MNKTAAALLFGLIILVGCNADGCSRKRQVGRVYRSSDGHLYVRSHERKKAHQDGDFVYWVWIDSGSSRGQWSRTSSIPINIAPTRLVVEEKDGEPIDEAGETPTSEDEVISEETTESEAEGFDSDAGGDAGSDSSDGGDGGGDGGGGGDD